MKTGYCIIRLSNVDTLKLINVFRLSETTVVDAATGVGISKLPVDRLKEAELSVHLHSVFA